MHSIYFIYPFIYVSVEELRSYAWLFIQAARLPPLLLQVEQVGQLAAFVQAYLNFTRTTVDTLESLSAVLQEK